MIIKRFSTNQGCVIAASMEQTKRSVTAASIEQTKRSVTAASMEQTKRSVTAASMEQTKRLVTAASMEQTMRLIIWQLLWNMPRGLWNIKKFASSQKVCDISHPLIIGILKFILRGIKIHKVIITYR